MNLDRRTFLRDSTLGALTSVSLSQYLSDRTFQTGSKGGIVNIKQFDAKGDGITDDRIAIQDAIDSIKDSGGTVFMPPGVYRLSRNPDDQSGLKIYSNQQIIGAGRGNTILKWMDDVTTTSPHFLLAADGDYVENVTISDFEIDGNKDKRGNNEFQILGEGIEINGKNILIRNMYIHDVLGEGIDNDNSDGMMITNVIVENTGGNGIHCSDDLVRDVLISNCITRNCAHGRKAANNRRYGGLVLRGSGIYVVNHRSIEDAQIANIEGEGLGADNEICLSQVAGKATREDSEGFRIGMKGKITLMNCRSQTPFSNRDNFRIEDFEGIATLKDCYSETFEGQAYAMSMNGTLITEGCTALAKTTGAGSHGFMAQVEGRVVWRNCEFISSQTSGNGFMFSGNHADIEVENCRYLNPQNISGHAVKINTSVNEVDNTDAAAHIVSVNGGDFHTGRDAASVVDLSTGNNSSIQVKDIKRCVGGKNALNIKQSDSSTMGKVMICGNHLEGLKTQYIYLRE
ncbi:MAG: glycosyl hydrolase family 28-related protein [Balneolales bacterium]